MPDPWNKSPSGVVTGPNTQRMRLQVLAGKRVSREGVVVFTAHCFGGQELNRRDAIERLTALIRDAALPGKKRRPMRPTRGSRCWWLETKQRRSEIKRGWSSKVDST
jgi:ribosome-associated protein